MKRALLLLAVFAAAALSGGVPRSQAVFVAATDNPSTSLATSALFNAVAVTMSNPGSPLSGAEALSATATSDRAIVSVRFQSAPTATGVWTDRCTATIAPYTCDWATTGVADGYYDLRAIALDGSGYTRTSATIANRRVENTAPAVSMTDPGTPLTATENLAATATDAGTGVASVTFAYRLNGSTGAWTTICTDASSTYGCAWNTAAVADGLYDLRASAVDVAGNSASSTAAARRVDNTAPTVAISDDGSPKHDTVTLSTTTGDGNGSGVVSVLYQFRATGTPTWADACTGTAGPAFSCTGDTNAAPDGMYDVRAIATDGAGFTATSAVFGARIDNTAPSASTMVALGTPLQGAVTLAGSGTDAGSGMASMRFEYKLTAGATWATACSDGGAPYACSFDTTTVADGNYDFRAVAIDAATNSTTSAVQTARRIDNLGPTVAITSPGPRVRATTTIAATATDVSPITSVVIQRATSGSSTFTTICSDGFSPYSCPWNTTALAEGDYDLRAVATDSLGHTSTSAVVTTTVDNSAPIATAVQAANGATAGRLDAGDTLTFTYSQTMTATSILAGWSGASTPVRLRVVNAGAADELYVYNAANTTLLGLMDANGGLETNTNLVGAAATLNAAMVRVGAVVTVTVGTVVTGATSTGVTAATMTWNPSASATNAAAEACWSTPFTETGATDLDF